MAQGIHSPAWVLKIQTVILAQEACISVASKWNEFYMQLSTVAPLWDPEQVFASPVGNIDSQLTEGYQMGAKLAFCGVKGMVSI